MAPWSRAFVRETFKDFTLRQRFVMIEALDKAYAKAVVLKEALKFKADTEGLRRIAEGAVAEDRAKRRQLQAKTKLPPTNRFRMIGSEVNGRLLRYLKQTNNAWPAALRWSQLQTYSLENENWLNKNMWVTFNEAACPTKSCLYLDKRKEGTLWVSGTVAYRLGKDPDGTGMELSIAFDCQVAQFVPKTFFELSPADQRLVQLYHQLHDAGLDDTVLFDELKRRLEAEQLSTKSVAELRDRCSVLTRRYPGHLEDFFYDLATRSGYGPWILRALFKCFAATASGQRTLPGYVMEVVTGTPKGNERLFPECEDAWFTFAADPSTERVCMLTSINLQQAAEALLNPATKSATAETLEFVCACRWLRTRWAACLNDADSPYRVDWTTFLKRVAKKGYYGLWWNDGLMTATKANLFRVSEVQGVDDAMPKDWATLNPNPC